MAPAFTHKSSGYVALGSQDEKLGLNSRTSEIPDRHYLDSDWKWRFFGLAYVSFLLCLVIGGLAYKIETSVCPSATPGAKLPHTPAPVEWVNKDIKQDPRFMGKPRLEMDQAWHELLAGTMIRFSAEEMHMANNATSARHVDGTGYIGGLGISHNLHCLKRIRQWMYPDYYYGSEEQDWDELAAHVDHCLETIRQALLCSADVNVFTLIWTSHSKTKPSTRVPQQHACVNWDVLQEWMLGRAASFDQMIGPDPRLYEGNHSQDQSPVVERDVSV
ncbi:hypothetical protein B0I35DRAFT_508060 [Stachybotrys elegans]|uniref:Tat pathway signal sequence n=1 Tax=Stachybotrys elegans TaxID=80388 RepID=A0A8K0WVR4_9HYPO|nr:hypothetical protein B0I35DRAFT_508060 [Stachybotrys elegans]